MNRRDAPAKFDVPPKAYDQQYFLFLVRTLNQFVSSVLTPGEIVGQSLTLINPPTNGYGLQAGAYWLDSSGYLKVVRSTDIYAPSLFGIGKVGTVTVA